MKIRLKRDSLFIRIVLSFTALVMVLAVTMTLFFSNMYSATLYEQVSREQIKGLETLSGNIDNLFKEMDQIFLHLEVNDDVHFFLASNISDPLTSNRARIQIRNIRQINPYIHSIFVYNSGSGEYISEGEPGFDGDGFIQQDETFHKSAEGNRAIYLTELKPTGSSPNFLTNRTMDYVISMEYTNRTLNGEQHSVVINLDEDLFVRDYLQKSGDELLIADSSGTLLAHTDMTQVGKQLSDANYFSRIQDQGAGSGEVAFDAQGEGQRSLVTYVTNQSSGWYILSHSPYKEIIKPIHDKRNHLLAVCLSILVMCLIAIFLISKRLYNPVQKLMDLFKRSQFNVSGAYSGDLSLIRSVYTDTLQRLHSLEDENRGHLQVVKESFLRRLLTASGADRPGLIELGSHTLNISPEHYRLCVFKIDGFSRLDSKEMTLYESALVMSIMHQLEGKFSYEAVQMPKGEVAVMINDAAVSLETGEQEEYAFCHLTQTLGEIQQSVTAGYAFSVSVGISEPVADLGDCAQGYNEALDMLRQRFVLGYSRIIHRGYVEQALTRSYGLAPELEKKLTAAIKQNDREVFKAGLDHAVNVLKGYVYADAVQGLFQLVLVCITHMNHMINDENKRLGVPYGELNLIFTELETLEQGSDWLIRQFDAYLSSLESIKQLREHKFYRKIEEIMHYIQENYADSSLSVEALAEAAGYTPNYFSKLFKEVTGINSGEFIRKVRMEKAKELLKNEEYRVSEVAEMCGYPNSSYFYSAFKKDVGLTPSSYRELSLSEKESDRGWI
ncbi:AraC family transcriptional regulator [Paenibacillus pinihumi]|uniref:AraC family transcriptional regulator n=1 Tax=Paenibacillus pinihumi TaxID=669462 RepID=UPI000400E6E1|nr:AraC family transcriptional regulator [Paenibacillus pinihumi]